MTTNAMTPYEASDEEILAGIRRRMIAAEALVPQPPVRDGGWLLVPTTRAAVRSHFAFAGIVPLAIVAMVLVAVVGVGLGGRPFGGAGTNPGPPTATIVYELAVPSGQQITAADLDTTVQVIQARLASIGVEPIAVAKIQPNQVSVVIPQQANLHTIRALLGQTGKLEFVLLPVATYGDANTPGSVAIPANGSTIDPSLPAQFTGSDIDRSKVSAAADPTNPGTWLVNFAFAGDKASEFSTWSGQHVKEFFAITLDRKVLSVPYIAGQIVGGSGEITGAYTEADAKQLAALLRAGTLPFPLTEISVSLGPTQPAVTPTNMGPEAIPFATAAPIYSPAATLPPQVATSGRTVGDPNAPVTLDVWQDYQCPLCAVVARDVLPEVVDKYVAQGKVRIVYHDLIVIDSNTGGTESADAANAALCAADQGQFATFQDWLWANQGYEGGGSFGQDRLVEMGRRAGLDMSRFQTCVDQRTHLADVNAESAAGQTLSLNGVPAILVNGKLASANDYATVSAAIDSALGVESPSPSITFAAALTTPPSASPAPSAAPTFLLYTVMPGDTLSAISARFAVTLDQLRAANPSIPADGHIEIGEQINVPAPS